MARTVAPSVIICSAMVVMPLGVALGVLDVGLDAGLLEGRLEVGTVEVLPTDRGLGVGEDHADLAGRFAAAVAAAARVAAVAAATCGKAEDEGSRESRHHWCAVAP